MAMALISFSFTNENNPLVGRWEFATKYQESTLNILTVFKADGTFDLFANKKPLVTGTYQVKHDTLFIADALCNANYSATYKLKFFGKQDSVQFNVIQDTCIRRKTSVNGVTYKNALAVK